ncbi:MAG: hypothetical protein K0B02_00280 [DPANN group archaeon]|nr:hypothetical protein [DPANN group archaeon]
MTNEDFHKVQLETIIISIKKEIKRLEKQLEELETKMDLYCKKNKTDKKSNLKINKKTN